MYSLITQHLDIWTSAKSTKSNVGRGNGSTNSQAIYGIKKLRELILELAVRGRLVPQDPNDEPARELIKNITKGKERLIKEGKIKKQKPLPKIGEDEKPFELPLGWEWARLPDVSAYKPGKTPSTKNPIYWTDVFEEGIPWVSISDMEQFGLVTSTNKKITRKAVEQVFKYDIIPAGSLLMSFKLTVGKISILDIDAYHNEAIISLEPFTGISRDYLFNILPKRALSGNTKSAIMGNTLNSESLALLLIPVPPLNEQHRIVAKVDELMALCDQLEKQEIENTETHQTLVKTLLSTLTSAADHKEFSETWNRIKEYFDILFTTEESIGQLKQTILQLAVMGKLVEQNPVDEPASELLKKIAKEKDKLVKEGKIKNQKPLPKINEDEKPFDLPDGWVWSKIGDATLYSEYGISEKTYDIIDGIPVIKMGDIQEGKILLGCQKKISKDIEGLPALFLKKWDLLYNRTNSAELVGKTGLFDGPDDTYTFASYLVRIRCCSNYINSAYINLAMNATYFRSTQIEPQLKQQCGQANVNATLMNNMLIPIPPLEVQHRIVAKVDELMTLCDTLKSRLNSQQDTQIKLADVITEKVAA